MTGIYVTTMRLVKESLEESLKRFEEDDGMKKSNTSAVEFVDEIIREFVIKRGRLPTALSVSPDVFVELFLDHEIDETSHYVMEHRQFTYRGIPIAIAKEGGHDQADDLT